MQDTAGEVKTNSWMTFSYGYASDILMDIQVLDDQQDLSTTSLYRHKMESRGPAKSNGW